MQPWTTYFGIELVTPTWLFRDKQSSSGIVMAKSTKLKKLKKMIGFDAILVGNSLTS